MVCHESLLVQDEEIAAAFGEVHPGDDQKLQDGDDTYQRMRKAEVSTVACEDMCREGASKKKKKKKEKKMTKKKQLQQKKVGAKKGEQGQQAKQGRPREL